MLLKEKWKKNSYIERQTKCGKKNKIYNMKFQIKKCILEINSENKKIEK